MEDEGQDDGVVVGRAHGAPVVKHAGGACWSCGARILREYFVTFFVNSLAGAIQRREPLGGQNA